MQYKVYALFNRKNCKIYIGQTNDLENRLQLHQNKKFTHSYTARFDGDWQIIYVEKANSRKEALLREKQLKSHQGREFLKKFIPR